MAGDWIKFEHATPRKPEVFQIAADLGIDTDTTVGLLIRFWVWVSENLSEKCPENVRKNPDKKRTREEKRREEQRREYTP